jgi:hypothetical protein
VREPPKSVLRDDIPGFAFGADAGQSGINPAQIQMMLDMMRMQMQQAKPAPAQP